MLDYNLKNWMALMRYVDDGNLSINNNGSRPDPGPGAI
ncbi:TPA: hypothetical protein SL686_000619 [Pseudomonas aeruginosa]|nr:hypothetical protein [Pseudomonas aeruginosa]MBG5155585.1 hypothetical protein [Pseudomonas aeruginosa]MCO2920809.1 hypothetical protein [Pseudomonas aeruginosa]MDV6792182.1 hypothetical protein [Pseudomonas aeruginosa]QKZ55355.1 hypothetical protein HWN50_05255 [Pseudomonas aeruginosa]